MSSDNSSTTVISISNGTTSSNHGESSNSTYLNSNSNSNNSSANSSPNSSPNINPLSHSGGWKNSIKPNQFNTQHQTLLSPSRKHSLMRKPFEILSSVSSNHSSDSEDSDYVHNNQNQNPPPPSIEFNKLLIDESNQTNVNSQKEPPKLYKQNSLKLNEYLKFDNSSNNSNNSNNNNNNNEEILVKIWLPMEYTGTLYKVRKFSGGKSTIEILNILNNQLAPFYQSPKNKLFLNNDDKPIPSNVTLKKLNLTKTDVIYIRREPEYEILAINFPNKGTLVLDKDIKVCDMLVKIENWLFDGVSSQPPSRKNSNEVQSLLNREHSSQDQLSEELVQLHNHHDDNNSISNYNLLKKLSVPTGTSTNTSKNGKSQQPRGYYLRLFDQKQISNYGIKIKDTLIFKKKAMNRGLGVDDAEGGIEIIVIYSPLSMYPTPSELIVNQDQSNNINNINSSTENLTTPPASPQLKFTDPLNPTPTTNNNNTNTMIKIEKPLLINDGDHINNDDSNNLPSKKTKVSKKTLSGVGLPFNVQHKTHVDNEYKWSGTNIEESFEFKEKLGQGGYGAVFRAQHKETGFNLAVKVLSVTPTRLKDIEKEMDLLKKCRCPNVLSYYGSISKLTELWILMDYCAVGSIKDMMKTCCDTLDEDQISAVTLCTLGGLGYLHSKGIVHLDVKAANILLTEDKQIKMADFGVSQQLSQQYGHSNVLIGSPLYMAPELILKAPFSSKADIWSLGITLIELAEGRPPGRGLKSMNQLQEIPNMPPPKLSNPKDWSPSFNDFLSKCLVKDPELRPSVIDLLQHPFIKGAKSTDSLNNMMKQCISIKEAQLREFEDNDKE